MIKIYDASHNFLSLLDVVKDYYTIETLDSGTKTLSFKAPLTDDNIKNLQEENYVETSDYSYVIKEINSEDNEFIEVYCNPNIEDLDGNIIFHFDCFETNPENGYKYCVNNTGWTVKYNSNIKTIFTIQEAYKTSLEGIRAIAEMWNQELWFDTKNKTLYVYDFNKMGSQLGAYYSNELDLKKLTKQSNSYDYATVLYPYGKDGLTIKDVNNDKEYIENYTYSSKYIQKIWVDEEIEYPDILFDKAKKYLDSIAQPKASYQVALAQIGNNLQLGDRVLLVDKIKRIKQKQRAVKITRFPFEPERGSVEISNLQPDLTLSLLDSQKKIDKELKYIKSQIGKITTSTTPTT